MDKHSYFFGNGEAEGDGGQRALLGGKGAGLAEMTTAGLPVPPGFTLTTATCLLFFRAGEQCPALVDQQMREHLAALEVITGRSLGDLEKPLLLSVRSGAAVSMPGMMDTVLNLGLNDDTVEALQRETDNPWYARDCYRRFLQMFGNVVLDVPIRRFEDRIDAIKEERGILRDTDLTIEDLATLIDEYKAIIRKHTGDEFPQDTLRQLRMARDAVYSSWFNDSAKEYRREEGISEALGTAVTVQAMVFGNLGWTSGSGVGFTRNPSTGEKGLTGDYLLNAQGEDVVAGLRTPNPIADMAVDLPGVHAQLLSIAQRLEDHYLEMQDFEFTISAGKLYMLQTRKGTRTGNAALRIAIEMLREGRIDEARAVTMVEPRHIEMKLHKVFVQGQERTVIGKGVPASPGAATGRICFTSEAAVEAAKNGPVVLVRVETSPEDVAGMRACEGILTTRGGMASHAAVVARQWGTCCVSGCSEATVDEQRGTLSLGENTYAAGDWISLDGAEGDIIDGKLDLVDPDLSDPYFVEFMSLVDRFRTISVRTNADQPQDAILAKSFGAEGIGLCRTEHMFFEHERLLIVQQMIMSENEDDRNAHIQKLLPYQKADFAAIFRAMDGLPCTVRLLDPPLGEFLPRSVDLARQINALERGLRRTEPIAEMIALLGDDEVEKSRIVRANSIAHAKHDHLKQLMDRSESLQEMNPMLGHRGCRLGITYPEITKMQTRAILEAACVVAAEGVDVQPEIMIPLVGSAAELKHQRAVVEAEAELVFAECERRVDYRIGTMIELPRACLVADEIAEFADFFSFGTNDLTQTTFGFSRDDTGPFVSVYKEQGLLVDDPFATLDQNGVGKLVALGVRKGRERKAGLKVGICGEHGGDPASIGFFADTGLDYVSCSPYRVPVARLAAAQHELSKQHEPSKS